MLMLLFVCQTSDCEWRVYFVQDFDDVFDDCVDTPNNKLFSEYLFTALLLSLRIDHITTCIASRYEFSSRFYSLHKSDFY